MTPRPRLLWILAAGLPVAALPAIVHASLWPLVFLGWALLLGGAAVDMAWLVRARPVLREVRAPRVVGVGDAVSVRAILEVGAPIRSTLRTETTAPLEPGPDVRLALDGGAHELTIPLGARQRGRGALDALWLQLAGPLGLVERIVRLGTADTRIDVAPSVQRVRQLTLEYFGVTGLRGGLIHERFRGDGTEYDALESYVPGMDLGAVDWKVSARHQSLRVRQYRVEKNQRVILCLDTGRLMAEPVETLSRLDHAIHAGLTVASSALRAGDLVGLHAYGAEPRLWLPPEAGVRHLGSLVQACASLEPRDVETNHVLGLHDLLTRLKRRSLVVVLTDFADSITAELMVETIGKIAQRHLVVFLAIEDPRVVELARQEPRAVESLAESVIASEQRSDRRRVLRRLSRARVDVVHGPPGPASLALLQRYVTIKRRGLIG